MQVSRRGFFGALAGGAVAAASTTEVQVGTWSAAKQKFVNIKTFRVPFTMTNPKVVTSSWIDSSGAWHFKRVESFRG